MSRRDIVQILAMAAFLVGFVSMSSYILNIPHLRTWSEPPMALNTAVCFVATNLAIIVWMAREKDE